MREEPQFCNPLEKTSPRGGLSDQRRPQRSNISPTKKMVVSVALPKQHQPIGKLKNSTSATKSNGKLPAMSFNKITSFRVLFLPPSSEDLLAPAKIAYRGATFYSALVQHLLLLQLSPFLFEDFLAALMDKDQNEMISQIHLRLLKTLIRLDKESDIEYGPPELGDSIKSFFFFADSLTWPECLKAYLSCDRKSNSELLQVFTKHPDYPIISCPSLSPAETRILILEWLLNQVIELVDVQQDGNLVEVPSSDKLCRSCKQAGRAVLSSSESFDETRHDSVLSDTDQEDLRRCNFCPRIEIPGFGDDLKSKQLLGNDRNGSKYWFICRRVFIRTLNDEIFYYSTVPQLKELLKGLDSSNHEKELSAEIRELIATKESIFNLTEIITSARRGSWNIRTYLGEENRILRTEINHGHQNVLRIPTSTVINLLHDYPHHSRPLSSSNSLRTSVISMQECENRSVLKKLAIRPRQTAQQRKPKYKFYKLGQDANFKSYKNLYANALSKDQLQELMSRTCKAFEKFSISKIDELIWREVSNFSRSVLFTCVVNSIVFLEKKVPKLLMCSNWRQARKLWLNKLRECENPRDLAHLLKTLVLNAKPELLHDLWGDFVGHTTLTRINRACRESILRSLQQNNSVEIKENDENSINQVKGWVWTSKNRRENQKNIDKLGLRNGNHSICLLYRNRSNELPKRLIISHKTFLELKKDKKVGESGPSEFTEIIHQPTQLIQVEKDLRGFKRQMFVKVGTTSVFLDSLLDAVEKKKMSSNQCQGSDKSCDSPDSSKAQYKLSKKTPKKVEPENAEANLYRLEKSRLKRLARQGGMTKLLGFHYDQKEDSKVWNPSLLRPLFHTACLVRLDSCNSLQGVAHYVKIFLVAFTFLPKSAKSSEENSGSQEICPALAAEETDAESDPHIVSEKISLPQDISENESEDEIIYSTVSSIMGSPEKENQDLVEIIDFSSPSPPAEDLNPDDISNQQQDFITISSDEESQESQEISNFSPLVVAEDVKEESEILDLDEWCAKNGVQLDIFYPQTNMEEVNEQSSPLLQSEDPIRRPSPNEEQDCSTNTDAFSEDVESERQTTARVEDCPINSTDDDIDATQRKLIERSAKKLPFLEEILDLPSDPMVTSRRLRSSSASVSFEEVLTFPKPRDIIIPLIDQSKKKLSPGLKVGPPVKKTPPKRISSQYDLPIEVACLVANSGIYPESCKVEISGRQVDILCQQSEKCNTRELISTIRGILTYRKVIKELMQRALSNADSCQVFITFKPLNYSKSLNRREGLIFVKERKLEKNGLRIAKPYRCELRIELELESDSESESDSSGSEDEWDWNSQQILQDGSEEDLESNPAERPSYDHLYSRQMLRGGSDSDNGVTNMARPWASKRARLSFEECDEEDDDETDVLTCVCKSLFDEASFYIGCDTCSMWFHPLCIGMTDEEAESVQSYTCKKCSRFQM